MSNLNRTLLDNRENPVGVEAERDIEVHKPSKVAYVQLVPLGTKESKAKTSRIGLLETRRRRANRRV